MVYTDNRSARKSRSVASLMLLIPSLVAFCALPSAWAGTSLERIVLQFHGPRCGSQDAIIISALLPIPGVRAVNLSTVPGHALIDIDSGLLAAQNVVETVRRLWPNQDACHVETMQSCISASPLSHIPGPSSGHPAALAGH